MSSYFFNQSWLCLFVPVFLCVFFYGQDRWSFIHSIFEPEKKTTREKIKNSFFIHSFDIPQKCTKTIFSGEIKKYDTFGSIYIFYDICITFPCFKKIRPSARPPVTISAMGSLRGSQMKNFIRQGKREALKPKGPLVEFFKELSFGG